MKKLLILAVITTLCGFSNYSFAACEPVACNTSAGNDRLNADTLEISGKARRSASRCYICEDGYCEDGDIVYNQTFSKFAVCRQSWGWIGDDRWKEYTPQHCTDETNLSNEFNRGMTGLGKYWKVNGVSHGATQATLIGATSTASGQSICYYYACQDGFTFDTQKRECVPESQVSQLPPTITQPTTPTQPVVPQPTPTQPSQPTTPTPTSICEARCKSLTGQQYVECTTCCKVPDSIAEKNNIENGFEDIQCTIGGQVVAGWGDEFRVGIQ